MSGSLRPWWTDAHAAARAAAAVLACVISLAPAPRERVFRPARPHSASEAELAAHKVFLETVKAPLWLGGT